ncbi:MAG: rhomboid family intramembrane serine protease [Lachnospiraceae bacterium]|nr:rhomboid family intramembrane serine protease [Lachnospiraceae bacterium]
MLTRPVVPEKKGGVWRLHKRLRITFNAPVVLSFVFLCFGATLLGQVTGGVSDPVLFMVYRASLRSPLTYIRFFTHVLGHVDWSHFIGNVSYLLLLGPMLEEKYGSAKIVEVIMSAAFVTGIVNFVFFPMVALCGASGVVFAFILLTSFAGFRSGEIPLTFILVAVVFIGQQVYDGITLQDNISNLSHILGGVVGAVLGFRLNMRAESF